MIKLVERITVNKKQCGGRPCIRGMRIRVSDVLELLDRLPKFYGLPAVTLPNISLKKILTTTLPNALDLLKQGEPLVEIGD